MLKLSVCNSIETQAQVVGIMMMLTKTIYILMLKKTCFFKCIFFVAVFSKGNKSHALCDMFLLSYRNTRESLGECQKLWKHMPVSLC